MTMPPVVPRQPMPANGGYGGRRFAKEILIPQQVGPAFEQLAQGPASGLDLIPTIDSLFADGDLGEVDLFLRPDLSDSDRSDVEQGVAELEMELLAAGALPWPGRSSIAILDWEKKTVRFLFLQGAAFLVVFASVLIKVATIVLAISLLVQGLEALGVPVPASISNITDAVSLIGAIAGGILLLRRFGIPLSILIPSGLLIFALLNPDIAFRILKWIAGTLGPALGINIPLLVAAGVLGVGGLVLAAQGRGGTRVLGVGGLVAGGALGFVAFQGAAEAFGVPELPPVPTMGIIEVVGQPTFAVSLVSEKVVDVRGLRMFAS